MKKCKLCDYFGDNFELNRNTCRLCRSEYELESRRTKLGHIKKIYLNQKKASQKRGHSLPDYSLDQLTEWVLSQEIFHILYNRWKDADYRKWDAPSIDRIDNTIGYCFENIRLMTWIENSDLAHEDCKLGKLSTGHKNIPIAQYTLDGVYIQTHPTMREAARSIRKQARKEIKKCCDGLSERTQGYIWKYANLTKNENFNDT